jgi:UDP-N-acetylmuramate dehydrogenase
MEALSGIPGTVGGAVFMNAGAYDREISDVVKSVRVFDIDDNNVIMLTKKDCGFSYRSSIFKKKAMIILSVELSLKQGKQDYIDAKMSDFSLKRNEKQPVDLPSSGSFFKRPEGYYAGKLIEEAGMKGARVGGAQVSEKHAGFIVNTGRATADDVLKLSEKIKYEVYEKFQVKLEEEPIVIGN